MATRARGNSDDEPPVQLDTQLSSRSDKGEGQVHCSCVRFTVFSPTSPAPRMMQPARPTRSLRALQCNTCRSGFAMQPLPIRHPKPTKSTNVFNTYILTVSTCRTR